MSASCTLPFFPLPCVFQQVEMLSKSSGSSDERTLSRVVQRVKAGTHTPMEAVAAEPSLNAHSGVERESYFRKARRHVAQLQAEGARRAASGTAAAYMAASQKAAATATVAAAAAAVAAAQKAVKAQPVDTFEEGTRRVRKTANTILSNKADKKRRVTKAFKESCVAYAGCKEAGEMTASEVCMSVALVHQLSPKSAPKPRMVKEFVRDGKVGESPGERGRKFKIGPELLDAVAAKQALSQARGVEIGSRSILHDGVMVVYICMLYPQAPMVERARGLALDVSRAAITEQGPGGRLLGP